MMNPVQEAAKSIPRPIHVFDVPSGLDPEVKSVGLIELTADEELQATRRSHGDTMRLAYELVKQAIVDVNGAKVGIADGTVDIALNKMVPKLRQLVMGAYGELHAPSEDASQAFFKSRKVRVG